MQIYFHIAWRLGAIICPTEKLLADEANHRVFRHQPLAGIPTNAVAIVQIDNGIGEASDIDGSNLPPPAIIFTNSILSLMTWTEKPGFLRLSGVKAVDLAGRQRAISLAVSFLSPAIFSESY